MTSLADDNQWKLAATPPNLDFGSVRVGSGRTLPMTLTNAGTSVIQITDAIIGNSFQIKGISLPLTLEPGHSFTIHVIFEPKSAGAFTGSINAGSFRGALINVPLMGTGTATGKLLGSPKMIKFGKVELGNTAQEVGTLVAVGGDVTVYSVTSSDREFALAGLTLPFRILAGQSLRLNLNFDPRSVGQKTATLAVHSNAVNSLIYGTAEGIGVPVQTLTVRLDWDPSENPIAGYNIYRGNNHGGPYTKINDHLDPVTGYMDNGVPGGKTFYYVTTAVNSDGLESVPSNEVKVTTPRPILGFMPQ